MERLLFNGGNESLSSVSTFQQLGRFERVVEEVQHALKQIIQTYVWKYILSIDSPSFFPLNV